MIENGSIHPAEGRVVELLEAGDRPTVDHLGGIAGFKGVLDELIGSRFSADFIAVILSCGENGFAALSPFVSKLVEGLPNDLTIMEAVDVLVEYEPLAPAVRGSCFDAFLALIRNRERTGIARAAALDGAFRLALRDRSQQLRLMAELLNASIDDDPTYLARAARAMGVANGLFGEDALLTRLHELAERATQRGVTREAAFELGLAELGLALESKSESEVLSGLRRARHWLDTAREQQESWPEADAFAAGVDLLLGFREGLSPNQLVPLRDALTEASFALGAAGQVPQPWLGARRAQAAYWSTLAASLPELAERLNEASWWNPEVVVERLVLSAYVASRRAPGRAADAGVELLVRPRIEASLASERGQAYALQQWLERNTEHSWSAAAQDLLERLEARFGRSRPPPPSAMAPRASVIAEIEAAPIPPEAKLRALAAVEDAHTCLMHNLSGTEQSVLESCLEVIEQCPDYATNPNARRLFNTVLVWSVMFLASRLNASRQFDSSVKYLFEENGGATAVEDDLKHDYHRYLQGVALRSEIEVPNVSGGRTDVRSILASESVITEVKRELDDSSLEHLVAAYGAQATEYQNMSARVGLLLVLDLTARRERGVPHITQLVHGVCVRRVADGGDRWLAVLVVPGRRLVPSEVSGASVGGTGEEAEGRSG